MLQMGLKGKKKKISKNASINISFNFIEIIIQTNAIWSFICNLINFLIDAKNV